MSRAGIVMVMGWLGAVGMAGSAGAQAVAGDGGPGLAAHIWQASDVRDRDGALVGSIDGDGTLRDRDGSSIGRIDQDGPGGRLSGTDRMTGALILLHRLPR